MYVMHKYTVVLEATKHVGGKNSEPRITRPTVYLVKLKLFADDVLLYLIKHQIFKRSFKVKNNNSDVI